MIKVIPFHITPTYYKKDVMHTIFCTLLYQSKYFKEFFTEVSQKMSKISKFIILRYISMYNLNFLT